MLFKILHGEKSRISTDITPYHEGYCYVTHDGDFYVDMNNERVKLNAKDAETLMGASLETILNKSNIEIPTSQAVLSALDEKANKTHEHDNLYYTENEIDELLKGKADNSHNHAIDDITNLKTTLAGKADSSHGTHVTYSTTAPVMDGTASAGSATTVARSDHKHPTDTSRAAKTDFDDHKNNTTIHITADERTNWNAAYTHSTSAHAPSNAEKNQNAFSSIVVSGQNTVAAETATDTVTFVGNNLTITTDANNDKVTFTVAESSTNSKGIVQLTDSTSSTSTTTAATPKSVKSAYDLANTANTNAGTAQSRADDAYDFAGLAYNKVYVGPTQPTDPEVKVWINTAEEGTGVIPVLPRIATITLAANAWSGSTEPYSQPVTIATVTSASKVDLQPTAQQIVALQNSETSIMIENNGGTLVCYAIGNKPTVNYTMQVLVQEVAYI